MRLHRRGGRCWPCKTSSHLTTDSAHCSPTSCLCNSPWWFDDPLDWHADGAVLLPTALPVLDDLPWGGAVGVCRGQWSRRVVSKCESMQDCKSMKKAYKLERKECTSWQLHNKGISKLCISFHNTRPVFAYSQVTEAILCSNPCGGGISMGTWIDNGVITHHNRSLQEEP